MKKIKLGGKSKSWTLVDDEDYEDLVKHSWYKNTFGYVRTSIKDKNVAMHRVVMKAQDGQQIDHINGNKLDNRKCNLRFCTYSQNLANRRCQKNNKCGYKGVYWSKHNKSWSVQVKIDKKRHHAGYYKDLKEAAKAYNELATKLFGEFARLNKVE